MNTPEDTPEGKVDGKPARPDRRTVGRVLSDMLADAKLSHVEAVALVNGIINANRISQVINGTSPISPRTAVILERILPDGRSAEEWHMHYMAKEFEVARAMVDAEIKARANRSVANASRKKGA